MLIRMWPGEKRERRDTERERVDGDDVAMAVAAAVATDDDGGEDERTEVALGGDETEAV